METLNFKNNKVQRLTLDDLARTHAETDVQGVPLNGIYHYQLIERIAEMAESIGLKAEIEEIFAAQSRNHLTPGVALLPHIEREFGPNAIEAHILRRVYTTIRIKDFDTDELTTGVAIAYHQGGIQIGFGTLVKICHNQTILGADKMLSTTGVNRMSVNAMLDVTENLLRESGDLIEQERNEIKALSQVEFSMAEAEQFVGRMQIRRVMCDTRTSSDNYALNQYQLNRFVEAMIDHFFKNDCVSAWQAYNMATNLYKPGKTEIPNILPQNLRMVESLYEFMNK